MSKNYWDYGVRTSRLTVKPNEDGSIGSEYVYVVADIKGAFKVLAAYKVVYEATTNWNAPGIKDIFVTTDKKALIKYNTTIKQLLAANKMKPFFPGKQVKDDGPLPAIEELKK